VLTHTNPEGDKTTYAYDTHANLTTITNALNENTTATYTTDGLLKAVTDPRRAIASNSRLIIRSSD